MLGFKYINIFLSHKDKHIFIQLQYEEVQDYMDSLYGRTIWMSIVSKLELSPGKTKVLVVGPDHTLYQVMVVTWYWMDSHCPRKIWFAAW